MPRFVVHRDRMTNIDTDALSISASVSIDPRELFARAVAVAAPVLDGTTRDHLRLPTPCTDYDVEQLLGHLLFAMARVAAIGRGDQLGRVDEVATSSDWNAEFRAAAAEVRAAWSDDRRLTDTVDLPWASMTGAEALGTYTNELTVHTWDLAQATGQCVEWDDEVVSAALAAIERELPLSDRDPIWQSFLEGAPAEVLSRRSKSRG
jgi:uncharacterized protein (TIGR03086 family)